MLTGNKNIPCEEEQSEKMRPWWSRSSKMPGSVWKWWSVIVFCEVILPWHWRMQYYHLQYSRRRSFPRVLCASKRRWVGQTVIKTVIKTFIKIFFNPDVIYFSKTCFVNPYVIWSLTRWALANTKSTKTKSNIQKYKYKIHNHKYNIQKLLYWSRYQKPELRCELEYEKGSVAITSR